MRGQTTFTGRGIFWVSVACGIMYLVDSASRSLGMNIQASSYLQIILPIYVAIYLLISMAVADRKYLSQRKTNEVLTERVDLEAARSSTLSRFLPKTLTDRFTTHKSIEENLSRVLKPRLGDIAIIQADLRGFSALVGTMDKSEVVRILNLCFGPVVDHAQKFSMVKLIGDCLFAFVENPVEGKSTVDLSLEIAAHLIDRVNWVNKNEFGEERLRFGIAIHYGQAMVGNFSSEQCIDYTVIGDSVNLTARLEELTKNPLIAERIGSNGIVISDEAAHQLARYRSAHPMPLDLGGVKIRSFENVRQIRFLPENQCLNAVFGHRLTQAEVSRSRVA